jgi:dihydrofolate synthase/folylpolyglutamate synthase
MNYGQALDFLYNLELFGVKLGLSNITRFLDRLGNPQSKYMTLHVGGTNGKGSTAAMLESLLVARGYKVGKFTSPHLVDYRERFRVNREKVSQEFVANFITDNRDYIRKEKVTFFETATALAFRLFCEENVDFGIAEVGLGGRLDATNVLSPELSLITQISLDHLKVLGDSIEKIAFEKAGIIKKQVPVLTSASDDAALRVLESTAVERETTVVRVLKGQEFNVMDVSETGTQFTYSRNSHNPMLYAVNLAGAHMAENAALALRAVEVLSDRGTIRREPCDSDGLLSVHWPARFQVYDAGCKTIFDVAHNPAGMSALADTLESVYPGMKCSVVLGMLQRRDFDKVFEEVARFADKLYICRPDSDRTAIVEELVRNAIEYRLRFDVIEDCASAYRTAITELESGVNCVVTGSHFTVGEVFRDVGITT